MRRRGRCESGFTMIELSMTIALVATGVLGIGSLLHTTHDVVTDSDRETRARMIERRNVDSLSGILRGVPIDTLANFDLNGLSTNPQFSRSVDIVNGLPQPTSPAQLLWQAELGPLPGVPNPGAVYLHENGSARVAARNVPLNGFAVEQDGKRLIIRLTTFFAGAKPEETVLRNSTTVVWPRN